MERKNNFYYLEPNDLEIVLDALEILYKQMGMHNQLGIETPYSKEDVEMVLDALKNSDKYKYWSVAWQMSISAVWFEHTEDRMLLLTVITTLFFIGITSLFVDSLINKSVAHNYITAADLDDDDLNNPDFLDLKQD